MATAINTYFATELLRKYLGDLLDVLNAISDPVTIALKLYAQNVITEKTLQKVLVAGQPEYERNQTILEAVRKAVKSKQERLLKFIDVLDQQSLADDMVAKMRSELSSKNGNGDTDPAGFFLEEVLRRGQVPLPVRCQVERTELVEKIRSELYKLRDNDGWVVIHGLPGFGKTTLAAESVRSAKLLQDVFPDGAFWLSVKKMSNKHGEVDTSKVLEKLQNFILRVDEDKYCPANIEAATDYLQKVMNEQHPRSLLILDDVWESEVAQAFSVRCRVLVTSRNADVASEVGTSSVYHVSITEGLSDGEAREMLARWSNKPVSSLPKEADTIIQYCRGSPLALGIIGAMLNKPNNSHIRWKAILWQLQGKSQALSRVDASIRVSIEELSEELKERFDSLVVFAHSTVIPTRVLATFWSMNEFEAEEIMNKFANKSLAQLANVEEEEKEEEEGKTEEKEEDYLSYSLHDVIMEYLKNNVTLERQKCYHLQLVQKYSDKCGGAFAELEEDGYIHSRLLMHVHAADNMELLGQLLTNLLWVAACCEHWYASALLDSCKHYQAFVPNEFLISMKNFQHFLSSHLDVLNNHPSSDDLIQLALNEEEDGDIYKQAEVAAGKRIRHSSWFIWNNKGQEALFNPFQVRPHFSDLKQCHYFAGGLKVASCSSSNVKLWEASTGLVQLTVESQFNQFTGCSINEAGNLLITCSDDSEEHTCVVWKVDTKPAKQLLKFTGHNEGVQCCALSPDSKLVVSADLASSVIIWKSGNGDIVNSWQHSDAPASSCDFSPRGNFVAIGDQAGYLKLWNLDGTEQHTFQLGTPTGFTSVSFSINRCVFSRNGLLIAAAVGDNTAKVWEVFSGQCLHCLKHSSQVLSLDLSSDNKQLVTGCENGRVKVWLLDDQQTRFDLPLHWAWVMSVCFSPTQDLILSAGENGIIRIVDCDLDQVKKPWKLYRRRFSIHFSSISSSGEVGEEEDEKEERRVRRVEVDGGSYEPTIVCYNMRDDVLEVCKGHQAKCIYNLHTPDSYSTRSWNISGDGKFVVIGFNEGLLQLMELTPEKPVERWRREVAHEGTVLHCYFSPDNNKIISCSHEDKCHKVWRVSTGDEISQLQNTVNHISIRPCVFFSDSVRVASAQMQGQVMIWNTETGEKLFACEDLANNRNEGILCLALSGDNHYIMASGASGNVATWDTITGYLVFTDSHTDCARSCALNQTGSLAAVGHDDCVLKIYDIGKQTVIAICTTQSLSWIVDTKFSPDENQIVTLSESVQWWSIDGKLQKRYLLKSTFGKYIHFSPDFKTFVTIDNTGLLYILSSLDSTET